MRRFESARRLHSEKTCGSRFRALPLRRWLVREPAAPDRYRRRWSRVSRSREEIARVLELRHSGISTKAIARDLHIPRSTVRYWLERSAGVAQSEEAIGLKPIQWGFESLHQHQQSAYAYLLGMYLGDGYIAHMPRACALRISLHKKQQDIANRVTQAILQLVPGRHVGRTYRRNSAAMDLFCHSQDWPRIFPQHGPGRKHTRAIVLAPWQQEIVVQFPEEFLRGCIESDGGRHRRIVNGKDYPAYSFKNHSLDILGLFAWACDLLGIRWRRSNRVIISIARRADVARLDGLMGLKPA